MKIHTWGRDSHGLFDYEGQHIFKKSMKTESDRILVRKENDVLLVPINDNNYTNSATLNTSILLKVSKHRGNYTCILLLYFRKV